jgi:hypothetical protein
MRRMELIELHDHARFPARLRDLMTDALQALWRFGNSYGAILPELHRGLTRGADGAGWGGSGAGGLGVDGAGAGGRVEVVDLCSGGGGPWEGLAEALEREYGLVVRVRLTDRYPNVGAVGQARRQGADGGGARVEYVAEAVEAERVPEALAGFRTIFSSFHHLGPAEARAVLRSAMAAHQGIGVFELARRGLRTVLVLCVTPLLVLLLTPGIRPFRWARIWWTYAVPVVPAVIWWDGLVSCLRAYAPEELEEMVAGLGREAAGAGVARYQWSLGEARRGLLPVTYLIGWPEEERDRA